MTKGHLPIQTRILIDNQSFTACVVQMWFNLSRNYFHLLGTKTEAKIPEIDSLNRPIQIVYKITKYIFFSQIVLLYLCYFYQNRKYSNTVHIDKYHLMLTVYEPSLNEMTPNSRKSS